MQLTHRAEAVKHKADAQGQETAAALSFYLAEVGELRDILHDLVLHAVAAGTTWAMLVHAGITLVHVAIMD